MEIKLLNAEYSYEYDLDIVNIKVNQKYLYRESIDFDVGVFLDLDENDNPVNLEIISASKRLNVDKDFLIDSKVDVNISINADLIELEVHFINRDEKHVLKYHDKHPENLKIANSETKFAAV